MSSPPTSRPEFKQQATIMSDYKNKRKIEEINSESEEERNGAEPSLSDDIVQIETKYLDPSARAEREKKWKKKLTILLSETEMLEYVTNKHELWRKEAIRRLEISNDQPEDPNFGLVKTIPMVIQLFLDRGYGQRQDFLGGVPYSPDHPKQIEYWNSQQIQPTFRKILINMPDGQPDKVSPDNSMMQQYSISADNLEKHKKAKKVKISESKMDTGQMHVIEATAIKLFVNLLEQHIPTFVEDYEIVYAFDGLQTDFFIRKNSWEEDKFVSLQMKSSNIQFGLKNTYNLKSKRYDNSIYCVAVGIQNLKTKTPLDCNDVSYDATMFEMFDVGRSRSLNPSPGIRYKSLENQRLYLSHSSLKGELANPKPFLQAMLAKFETWPKHSYDKIMFIDIGEKISPKNKTEKLGLQVLDRIVSQFGSKSRLNEPRRQNETVDSFFTKTDGTMVAISNKTASIQSGNPKQRYFKLTAAAPNHNFCDVVVAWYPDLSSKFAVISSAVVYTNDLHGTYSWNENSRSPNVRIFNDTAQDDGLAFFKYLCSEQ